MNNWKFTKICFWYNVILTIIHIDLYLGGIGFIFLFAIIGATVKTPTEHLIASICVYTVYGTQLLSMMYLLFYSLPKYIYLKIRDKKSSKVKNMETRLIPKH